MRSSSRFAGVQRAHAEAKLLDTVRGQPQEDAKGLIELLRAARETITVPGIQSKFQAPVQYEQVFQTLVAEPLLGTGRAREPVVEVGNVSKGSHVLGDLAQAE